MTTNERPRFDIAALRELAGDKVFARGKAYQADGKVVMLGLDAKRVLAHVEGSETYRTEVTGHGTVIGGTCSCPAVLDWGFCKHMVATVLAANAAGPDGDDAFARIKKNLEGRGIDALVAMILDLASRDPALFRRLDIAAATTNANDGTVAKKVRDALDTATRAPDHFAEDTDADWADGLDQTLGIMADLVAGGRGGVALELARHAIDRIHGLLDQIDDSEGHCLTLLHRAGDIHLAAARATKPDPVALAQELFGREMEDDYDVFGGAARHYDDVLGAEGLATYRELAAEAWAKLPPRSRGGYDPLYDRLKDILDIFAEREGDIDVRIALRAKDLSSPWRYLQLAEFCAAQGRHDEALSRAEEGLWVFEDGRVDERLVAFTVGGLVKAGRRADAGALLWTIFKKAPTLSLYKSLRQAGDETSCATVSAFLEKRLLDKTAARYGSPADLLVQILMHEKNFDAAWVAVRRHGASKALTRDLAKASETTHHREALEIHGEHIDELVEAGGTRAYDEAAKLVRRMAGLRSTSEQTAYLVALKTRFARRRNFMKLLD